MNPACEALIALAGGHCPAGEALLPNIRLEGWGSEAAGEEAVLDLPRSAPLESKRWEWFADDQGAAVIADDAVWIADTVGSRLRRVWRLGPGQPAPAEPMLAVPFDTELQQARRTRFKIALQGLSADVVAHVASVVEQATAGSRARAFLLRAITDGENMLLLFAVYRLVRGEVMSSAFIYTAARLCGGAEAPVILRDAAGEAAAEQRIGIPRL